MEGNTALEARIDELQDADEKLNRVMASLTSSGDRRTVKVLTEQRRRLALDLFVQYRPQLRALTARYFVLLEKVITQIERMNMDEMTVKDLIRIGALVQKWVSMVAQTAMLPSAADTGIAEKGPGTQITAQTVNLMHARIHSGPRESRKQRPGPISVQPDDAAFEESPLDDAAAPATEQSEPERIDDPEKSETGT